MNRIALLNISLLIIWLGVIFFLSSEPSTVSSARSGVLVDVLKTITPNATDTENITFLVRKAAHITAYFILGILVFRVIRAYKLSPKKAVILSAAIVMFYAITDELHQLLVNGRSGEVRDVLIDTAAGAIGVLITFFIIRRYDLRKPANLAKTPKIMYNIHK